MPQLDEDEEDKTAVDRASGKAEKMRRGNADSLKNQTAGASKSIDDPALQRDFLILFKKYLKYSAIVDIAANIPFIVILSPHIFVENKLAGSDDQYGQWNFMLCMSLVNLRLWHVNKVGQSMSAIFSILQDIFYLHRYTLSNLLSWTLASVKLIVFLHYFSCGWIFI